MGRVIAIVFFLSLLGCGKEGPPGATGPAGAQGPAGSSDQIESLVSCARIVGSLYFRYQHVLFHNGDAFVSCGISNATGESAYSRMYDHSQVGAATGGCIITYDIDTATAGYWIFERSGSTASATYHDPSSASDQTSDTFASSECTTL